MNHHGVILRLQPLAKEKQESVKKKEKEKWIRAATRKGGMCVPLKYSRTSHNGPSEKRTTSLQWTNTVLQIQITIVLIHK